MGGNNAWWQRCRSGIFKFVYLLSPARPWTPAIAVVLALAARSTSSTAFRILTAAAAVILFLYISVDVARSLWEPDRGPQDPLRSSPAVPIRPFHAVLAAVLAVIYTFLILGILISFLIMRNLWVYLIISPFVFLTACLVAWHNVRLWSYQGAEYEQMLNDEKELIAEKDRLKKMRLPASHWEHPQN